jgi:tRNA (guanine-N7-)-methyltransferase
MENSLTEGSVAFKPASRRQDSTAETRLDLPIHSPLHGRRRGKKLRAYHCLLIEAALPRLALNLSETITDAAALFPHRPDEIWLEIGFGGGEHLAALAAEKTQAGVIGCEAFHNGMAKALALIDANPLTNIRLYEGDAGLVIDALPNHCLAGVYLLYPDPWPKRRQHKRRFLSDSMLARLARVMRPGAELRFATDIDHNAGWTLARVLRSSDFTWAPNNAANWQTPWEGWSGTRYEAKALLEGRKPAYFTFYRTAMS